MCAGTDEGRRYSPPPMCAGTDGGWRSVSPLVVQLSVGRRCGAAPAVLPAGGAVVWQCPRGRGGGSGGRGGSGDPIGNWATGAGCLWADNADSDK